MNPRIVELKSKHLVGMSQKMSFIDNKTFELWQRFSKRSGEITNRLSDDFISLQNYPKEYFKIFKPATEFVKWACVEVDLVENIPENLDRFTLIGGLFAVFEYKGSSSAHEIFQYIYGQWIPNSDYHLDDRPHFEVLGAKYNNDDPTSEEELWIPIKTK